MGLVHNPVVAAYVTCVFFASGLCVNAIQLASLALWPVSRSAYRKINSKIVLLYWEEVIAIAEWWAGVRIRIFGEQEALDAIGKESAIALCTHLSDIDWLIGWMLCHNYGILGNTKCLLKKELAYIPVLGWTWWFLEYVFLDRNWEKDRRHLSRSFDRLRDFPIMFLMVVFAEGTRWTQAKYDKSVEFCNERDLTPMKNLLYPRTKGFQLLVDELRGSIDCVFDLTISFVGEPLTWKDLVDGKSAEVLLHVGRVPMLEVPSDPEGISDFCINRYRAMDARLDELKEHGAYLANEEPQFRRKSSAIISMTWVTLFTAGVGYFTLPLAVARPKRAAMMVGGLFGVGITAIYAGAWFAKRRTALKASADKRTS